MATWQVQKAKAHLSDLLDDAETKGPQVITKHGKETAVVLSINEYRTLAAKDKPNLLEVLLSGPKLSNEEIEELFARDQDTGREIEL